MHIEQEKTEACKGLIEKKDNQDREEKLKTVSPKRCCHRWVFIPSNSRFTYFNLDYIMGQYHTTASIAHALTLLHDP
jgi:hypothetical protein